MNLLNKLLQVSSLTMLSRVMGFVRDNIIARVFGASIATDAFFVAFKIPNLLRRIFAEGAFAQSFIPILAEYKEQQSAEQTRIFIAFIAGLLTLSLAAVTFIGVLSAPFLVWISAPGFALEPDKFDLTVTLLRVVFPYIFLISLSSFASAILNTWNIFNVPALAPLLLNLSMIIATLWLAPMLEEPVLALGFAVLVGGVLQIIYQLPFLSKIGMLVLPRINFKESGVWRVLKNMFYAMIGVSVAQISLLINTVFASFLVVGSVSWMYYADRLMELPAGVLGVALGTLLLPSLSKNISQNKMEQYYQLLNWGLRLCILLAFPCAVGLMLLAKPITVALFQYGQFSDIDAIMTQQALIAYAVGLVALLLIKVLAPGFYARQNVKTPVKIAIFSLCVTQTLNALFLYFTDLGHVGLALAISLAAWINAGLLFCRLRSNQMIKLESGFCLFISKILISLMVMSLVVWNLDFMVDFAELSVISMFERLVRLLFLVILGAISYLISLWILGIRLRDFIIIRL